MTTTPDTVKVIFLINPQVEDQFLSFFNNLGLWPEQDFTSLQGKLDSVECILLHSTDLLVTRIINRLNEPKYFGKIYFIRFLPIVKKKITTLT